MGTRVEVFNFEKSAWVDMDGVPPGERDSLFQILPEGERIVYSVFCEHDDTRTVIAKVELGVLDHPVAVLEDDNTRFMVVTILEDESIPFQLTFKSGVAESRVMARFSHVPEGGSHE